MTNKEKWEGLNGTNGLQHQLSNHAELVNNQPIKDNIRLEDPESR